MNEHEGAPPFAPSHQIVLHQFQYQDLVSHILALEAEIERLKKFKALADETLATLQFMFSELGTPYGELPEDWADESHGSPFDGDFIRRCRGLLERLEGKETT